MRPPPGVRGEVVREARLAGRLVAGAGVAAAASIPLLALLVLVTTGYGPLAALDASVADGLNAWARRRPGVVSTLEVLELVAHPWTFRVLVLLAAVPVWRAGSRRLATWAVTTMAVGGCLVVAVKELVQRARPTFPEPVASASYFAFPSGHATNSLLGVSVLLLLWLPVLGRRGRVLASAAGAAAVAVTAFDRVALGVHFLTDVLAGWILAVAVLLGTSTAFGGWRRHHPRTVDRS